MGNANLIRTLGDYSKPSYEGYRNTIELPEGNNVVPLRPDTIQLVQNRCSFHGLRSEDPNQHLKDFLKLVDSLDLYGAKRERTRLRDEEKNDKNDITNVDDIDKTDGPNTEMPVKKAEKENEAENGTKNEPIKRVDREEAVEAPNSKPVGYYLKHRINEKLIEELVDNHRFNESLSEVRVKKMKGKTYKLLPRGPIYDAILKKNITKKEDIGGNFEIPCNIRGLKHINALVEQGSDVNVTPLSTYMKLTDEKLAEIDIRLSLASHSYIYPLGIAKDVLVDVTRYVYPMDFVILYIKEDEKRPFILGTPFLTTAKAVIKFDKGTIIATCKFSSM
ncbi:MAK10-like protein [Tanacetum coccineum]